MNVDLFGLLFAAFAGIFLVLGAWLAWSQALRLARYRPVPATVITSEVGVRGGENNSYYPNIHFSYVVHGQQFESRTPMPVSGMSASGNWASQIVVRYPAGTRTMAYIDPEDPHKAFLIHEVSFLPYIFILFPMIHFAIGLGLYLGGGTHPHYAPSQATLITAIAWNVVGIVCMMHYRWSGGLLTLGKQIAFILYGGVGLILLVVAPQLPKVLPPPSRTVAAHPATRPVKKPVRLATRPAKKPATRPAAPLPDVERP